MPLLPQWALMACFMMLPAVGHRSSKAVEQALVSASESEDVEGVDDYYRAGEFEDTWVQKDNYEKRLEELQAKVEKMQSDPLRTSISPEEAKNLLKDLWMITAQKLADVISYTCFNVCLLCEPSPAELAGDQLKTITMTRSKDYKDKAKMALLAPADATGGLITGIFGGLATAGISGAAVGIVTAEKVDNGFLSLMAGIVSGAVTAGVVLPFAATVLPLLAAAEGVGLTGAYTNCARVGFEEARNGSFLEHQPFQTRMSASGYGLKLLREAMHYNKSWFEGHNFRSIDAEVFKADKSSTPELQDYKAMSHCEYLRLRPFDIRHAMLCARHSMLCGRRGGMLLPGTKDSQCAAASKSPDSNPFEGLGDLFQESKEKAMCIKLLCTYGGYKKAALKLHPDRFHRLLDMSEAEKQAKTEDFKMMVNCKDKFQLTMDSAEERDESCI